MYLKRIQNYPFDSQEDPTILNYFESLHYRAQMLIWMIFGVVTSMWRSHGNKAFVHNSQRNFHNVMEDHGKDPVPWNNPAGVFCAQEPRVGPQCGCKILHVLRFSWLPAHKWWASKMNWRVLGPWFLNQTFKTCNLQKQIRENQKPCKRKH